MARSSAVVFAYSGVGVRCLCAVLASDIEVSLVVTHEDEAGENIWFDSVSALAGMHGIEVMTPSDPNTPEVLARVGKPDWLFSFYYRRLLNESLLAAPRQGAYNMHGSLLPKFRGRSPINWAILKGATETGASLHRMVEKPDAGALVDQQSVPILPNDTAQQVYDKVACAAEIVLARCLPKMVAGTITERPLDLSSGSYYGGRKPEDGRIDWRWSALEIHNLVRAVAPPWPGAFFDVGGKRIHIFGSHYTAGQATSTTAGLYWQAGELWADCADGRRFRILSIAVDGESVDEKRFHELFGKRLDTGA